MDTSSEIVEVEAAEVALVNPRTGEALDPTVQNAALVLDAAREMKYRLNALISDATQVVVEASRLAGTKTLRVDDAEVKLSGGPTTEYDPEALREALRAAVCPEERIDACIRAEIVYKVDRSVLRQLVGANEDYRAAADLAERPTFKGYSVRVERR